MTQNSKWTVESFLIFSISHFPTKPTFWVTKWKFRLILKVQGQVDTQVLEWESCDPRLREVLTGPIFKDTI